MALQVRRVVTGHDVNGRGVVKIDEVSKNLVSGRSGQTGCGSQPVCLSQQIKQPDCVLEFSEIAGRIGKGEYKYGYCYFTRSF